MGKARITEGEPPKRERHQRLVVRGVRPLPRHYASEIELAQGEGDFTRRSGGRAAPESNRYRLTCARALFKMDLKQVRKYVTCVCAREPEATRLPSWY